MPQHFAPPPAVTAQPSAKPALIALTPDPRSATSNGTVAPLAPDPFPSAPHPFDPQHLAMPVLVNAQVVKPPAVIAAKVGAAGLAPGADPSAASDITPTTESFTSREHRPLRRFETIAEPPSSPTRAREKSRRRRSNYASSSTAATPATHPRAHRAGAGNYPIRCGPLRTRRSRAEASGRPMTLAAAGGLRV